MLTLLVVGVFGIIGKSSAFRWYSENRGGKRECQVRDGSANEGVDGAMG